MFVIFRVFNFRDVVLVGKVTMILALPMTYVVAEQFQADKRILLM